jgi:micrococcal nuclease
MTKLRPVLLACLAPWLCATALVATAATKAKDAHKPKAPPPPVELTGTVTRVVDGDTLWLKTAPDEPPVVVRLEGIDAPELCQAGGKEAAAWLTDMALNRNVVAKPSATDDAGRTVAKVFDAGRDLGDRMVRDGHAWSLRYQYDRGPYMAEERMAQALRRGLHAEAGAVQPRDFLKAHGPCK